jgi:nucleoside-diphosphate-sugar epimerase
LTTLVIGSGLIGSQVARILAERGDKPVLMDRAAQPHAIGQIVDLGKVTLIAGDVLQPLSIIDAVRTHDVTKIVHTALAALHSGRLCRDADLLEAGGDSSRVGNRSVPFDCPRPTWRQHPRLLDPG